MSNDIHSRLETIRQRIVTAEASVQEAGSRRWEAEHEESHAQSQLSVLRAEERAAEKEIYYLQHPDHCRSCEGLGYHTQYPWGQLQVKRKDCDSCFGTGRKRPWPWKDQYFLVPAGTPFRVAHSHNYETQETYTHPEDIMCYAGGFHKSYDAAIGHCFKRCAPYTMHFGSSEYQYGWLPGVIVAVDSLKPCTQQQLLEDAWQYVCSWLRPGPQPGWKDLERVWYDSGTLVVPVRHNPPKYLEPHWEAHGSLTHHWDKKLRALVCNWQHPQDKIQNTLNCLTHADYSLPPLDKVRHAYPVRANPVLSLSKLRLFNVLSDGRTTAYGLLLRAIENGEISL
jgi:hypothetical protein